MLYEGEIAGRRRLASRVLNEYAQLGPFDVKFGQPHREHLVELLTDIMAVSRANRIDFDSCLTVARQQLESETHFSGFRDNHTT